MSSVARRTLQQAIDDLDAATTSRSTRLPSVRNPFAGLFGESRTLTLVALTIAFIACLLLVRPMIMSMLSWHRTASLLNERRSEVADLRARHTALQERKAYYETDAFVAERARTYGLVRPGEESFVVRELVRSKTTNRTDS